MKDKFAQVMSFSHEIPNGPKYFKGNSKRKFYSKF